MKPFRRVTSWLVVLILLPVLAACSDDSPREPPPFIIPSVAPQPGMTVIPGCQPADLESWYEVAYWQIETFQTEATAGLELPRGGVSPLLARLQDLRNRLADQDTPECTSQLHSEILARLNAIILAFERFGGEDIDEAELRDIVNRAQSEINTAIAVEMERTQADLETRLQDERATQAADPGE